METGVEDNWCYGYIIELHSTDNGGTMDMFCQKWHYRNSALERKLRRWSRGQVGSNRKEAKRNDELEK